MATSLARKAAAEHAHAVQFYENDEFLFRTVADFLGAGIASGERLLVFATGPHNAAFRKHLSDAGFDVDRVIASGQLSLNDAEEALSRFMVDGMPDWDRFRAVAEGAITKAKAGYPGARIRAYGEMVDVLWRQGNTAGAIRLEELWNDLGKLHAFHLLCAYVMANFYRESALEGFERVCSTHSHVVPAETFDTKAEPDDRFREIAKLQQRARALEHEIAQRLELEETLRSALRDRDRLIEAERAARQEARDADRRKDEFLAMLGHELRNPLAPILTALQLMNLRGVGADREQRVIERQVRHLVRLVDDLLDVSRITRGKVELKKERLEISAALAKAIEMASPLFEQRSHSLEILAPRVGLVVDADPVRVSQVLANLLTNAAKYTDAGGHVSVSASREGDQVVISVKDDGMGISPELLPKIFDLFHQGERTIDRSQGGLGIGLTLARNLVELHGGTISCRSEGAGKGSEFVVRLPAALGVEARVAGVLPSLAVDKKVRRKVLVVDDNFDAGEMLADALRALGHDVAVAADGPHALSIYETFRPDVAVLDIGLPVMDGYELAQRLKQAGGKSAPRLFAVTGYGQDSDKAKAREAGFEAHLVKPVDLTALATLVAGETATARVASP